MFTKLFFLWPLCLKASEIRENFKSKSISILDPELNLTQAPRSMESVGCTSLVGRRTHQISPTPDPVVKREVGRLNQIYQSFSTPLPSATSHRWKLSSSVLPALMPQPPAKPQSFPITSPAQLSRHMQRLIGADIRELGFVLLGLALVGPCSVFWYNFRSDGPSTTSNRSRSGLIFEMIKSCIVLFRQAPTIGRGHLSWSVLKRAQGIFDHIYIYRKQISIDGFNVSIAGFALLSLSIFSYEKNLPISSLWERSLPSSSLFREIMFSTFSSVYEEDPSPCSSLLERPFMPSSFKERVLLPLCSLSMRDVSFPVVKPRMFVMRLIDILSCVEDLCRPEDAIGIVTSSVAFSKSQVAKDAVTILQLANDFVVRIEVLSESMNFKASDSIVDMLSSFYQLDYLSSCCFIFCASVLVMFIGLCPMILFFL